VHFLQWFAATFGDDEVRNGASRREALDALFEAGGGSLLTVATVLYIGAVVSGHFKNELSSSASPPRRTSSFSGSLRAGLCDALRSPSS